MIPLVVHSHYSLMQGTASVFDLCKAARQRGFKQLALTDTDNLYGLMPFLTACKQEEITPIVGSILTNSRTPQQAVCLVENEQGYTNLCRLISKRHCDSKFDLARAVLDRHEGLTILTTDIKLLQWWTNRGIRVAAALPQKPNSANQQLYHQAAALNIPAVAVPASFYIHQEDFNRHRLLRAIACNTTLSRLPTHETASTDAYLADAATYDNRFAVWPEVVRNTELIAKRCQFRGPNFGIVMPPYTGKTDAHIAQELRQAAFNGAFKRYGHTLPQAVIDRLQYELHIIEEMGFTSYFLVVRDIVTQSSRTCGRGSGAASLVSYCLNITNVCPIKHNLYFERFLNPGRKDPPDIDVDFAWDERDDILQNVLTTYGRHAALVCNHVTIKLRSAIRETAKVFGLPVAEISSITKKLPWFWRQEESSLNIVEELQQIPTLKGTDFPAPWPKILHLALKITCTPRYLSVHPGGVVITPKPVCHYVPVEIAPKGVPILQWEKDATEEAGLVKIDLLGNRSLGVIRDSITQLHTQGITFDENRWQPEDDLKTQATIAKGLTMGCFYIESPAMRLLQEKAGTGDFEHLVIHSSIIRPAANEFIREYIRRLHGGKWKPLHPDLADVLADTFGIMVYQEDVSRVAVKLAGFSHADADGLRKVLSKKDKHRRLLNYKHRFFTGTHTKGIPTELAEKMWQMMMSFDGYSFCKPHSASYAKVSFQAAYLKTHFPAEFMAAVISNQGGFYSTFAYVSEARRMGLTLLSPDVQESSKRWTGKGKCLRVGLMALKQLNNTTSDLIIKERSHSPFKNFEDFLNRVSPSELEIRALIHAGAVDSLNSDQEDRTSLLWRFASWQHIKHEKYSRNIFESHILPPTPVLPPTDTTTRLRREFATLGFLVQHHPMALYRSVLSKAHIIEAKLLPAHVGKNITCAGWLITGKTVRTKHGDTMEFLTFEDETGLYETTFFPQTYKTFCHLLETGRPFLLTGKVEEDYGAITLTVTHVRKLQPGVRPKTTAAVGHRLKAVGSV